LSHPRPHAFVFGPLLGSELFHSHLAQRDVMAVLIPHAKERAAHAASQTGGDHFKLEVLPAGAGHRADLLEQEFNPFFRNVRSKQVSVKLRRAAELKDDARLIRPMLLGKQSAQPAAFVLPALLRTGFVDSTTTRTTTAGLLLVFTRFVHRLIECNDALRGAAGRARATLPLLAR
jgi:hypothetical protein